MKLVDHEPRGVPVGTGNVPLPYSSGTIQRPGTGRMCGLETRHRHLQVLYYPDLPHRVLLPSAHPIYHILRLSASPPS